MPDNQQNIERLDLRFQVEPAPDSHRFSLPGGWLVWCLLGIGLGLGCWFVGRDSLARSLSSQLSAAESAEQALLALDGLLMLDANASLEIVAGLEHADSRVSRTAFRTLDAQITRWQKLGDSQSMDRLSELAARLQQMPESASPNTLMLASGLASRIYTVCIDRDAPELASVLAACEAVIRRAGTVQDPHARDNHWAATDVGPVPFAAPRVEAAGSSATLSDPVATTAARSTMRQAEVPLARDELGLLPAGVPLRTIEETSASTSIHGRMTSNLQNRSSHQPLLAESQLPFSETVDGSSSLEATALHGYGMAPVEMAVGDPQSPQPQFVARTGYSLAQSHYQARCRLTQPTAALGGIDELEIEQLVRLLASVQPNVVQSACLALRKKGMSETRLALACELATCSAARRLQLLGQIAANGESEPTPWLLWMAEDGQPEVRKLAVSLLSSMVDPHVERSLRVLLNRERDAEVEQTIRQTLLVGPQRLR